MAIQRVELTPVWPGPESILSPASAAAATPPTQARPSSAVDDHVEIRLAMDPQTGRLTVAGTSARRGSHPLWATPKRIGWESAGGTSAAGPSQRRGRFDRPRDWTIEARALFLYRRNGDSGSQGLLVDLRV